MHTDPSVPSTTLELRTLVADDATVTLAVHEAPVAAPGPDEVVVQIGAAPINPSDLGLILAGGDPTRAEQVEVDGRPAVRIALTAATFAANAARVGNWMVAGNEGGGTVVAAGSGDAAQALLGKVVGFLSGNAYAGYRTLNAGACLAMPDGITPDQAAASFVNPLTALGMVETMRLEGHTALVHTVGASNLGQMLNRICLADGVGLVNIVRSPAHVALLHGQAAQHVVDSSADTFRDDLVDALRATGATIAFDAIGGGELAGTVLSCMERVATEAAAFSRYGSSTHKQVYVYGGLDRSPTVLRRDFGMAWSIGGWLLKPFLMQLGADDNARLRQRVADQITTTFASSYGLRLSLTDVVDPAHVAEYGRVATGQKALITP